MRLVRVALLDEDAGMLRRRGLVGRGSGRLGKRVNSSSTAPFPGRSSRLPTRNAPPFSGAQRRSRKDDDPLARERVADVLGRSEHGPPQRVIAERGLVDQMLGHHRGLVVGARDLLDDHPALAVQLIPVDPRAARRSR